MLIEITEDKTHFFLEIGNIKLDEQLLNYDLKKDDVRGKNQFYKNFIYLFFL